MTLQQALINFKGLIEGAIIEGGNKAKTAMIRSSRPILNIHEAVKSQLIHCGVNPSLIHPPIGERSPELKIAGALKQKDQDISVIPNNYIATPEVMNIGLLNGIEDIYGQEFTRRTLTVNVRSQISSIQKNFDTLYERTFSEAQNLHERCPDMVLGEVYMIAIPEYNDKKFSEKDIAFKPLKPSLVEKYIKSFQALTNRRSVDRYFFQYEATCLLIVDFNRDIPKVYHSTGELVASGLLPKNTNISYEGLEWESFASKLKSIHESRFGKGILT